MIVWAPAVLSVLYAFVLYFCICTCSVQLSMFHMERRSRNTLTTIIFKYVIFSGNLRLSDKMYQRPGNFPLTRRKNEAVKYTCLCNVPYCLWQITQAHFPVSPPSTGGWLKLLI